MYVLAITHNNNSKRVTNMEVIENFLASDLSKALDPTIFSLILFPTEQCNFRCVYCYEDFELGKMSSWVIEAIKDLVKVKVEQIDELNFSWFGGEPLLAKSVIYEISEYAQKVCNEVGVSYSGSVTTNGYNLDLKTLEKLVSLNQARFQISLDGDESQHNLTRVKQNGSGTFDRIWANLIAAKNSKLDFKILLRIHVTDENIDSIERLNKKLEAELLDDPRFHTYFKEISNLGGNNKDRFEHLIQSSKDNQKLAKNMNDMLTSEDATGYRKDKNYICYAAQPNTLAIRSDGTLSKCTVALNNPANKVGKIKKDGSLNLDVELFKLWSEGFVDLDKKKLHCPIGNVSTKFNDMNKIEVVEVA